MYLLRADGPPPVPALLGRRSGVYLALVQGVGPASLGFRRVYADFMYALLAEPERGWAHDSGCGTAGWGHGPRIGV